MELMYFFWLLVGIVAVVVLTPASLALAKARAKTTIMYAQTARDKAISASLHQDALNQQTLLDREQQRESTRIKAETELVILKELAQRGELEIVVTDIRRGTEMSNRPRPSNRRAVTGPSSPYPNF